MAKGYQSAYQQSVPKKVDRAFNKADAWGQGKLEGEFSSTPFIQGAARESWDVASGAMRGIGGMFSGDKDQIKSGAKQFGGSVYSALTGGALRNMNKPPPRQFVGGSEEAMNQRLGMYQGGIAQGQDITGAGLGVAGQGVGMASGAADQAVQDRQNALSYGQTGMGIGSQGLQNQNAMLSNLVAQAQQRTPSLAQAQLQQGLDQTQRGMLGMAAQTRGGNQAAALRNAQRAGTDMALQTNQQAALLRAQEEQQRQQNILGAQQYAAGAYGGQAGLGYGMGAQGLGYAQGSTNQLGNLGLGISDAGLGAANVGLGTQTAYLGGLSDMDKAQAELDAAHQSNTQAARGGIMGAVGKGVGMLFGG